MENSRTKNTSRNIAMGLMNRMVSTFLPFLNRTILIYTLGIEYAGLSSLFLSILSVLSLAELGFNIAIVYSMYGPAARNDKQELCKLLTLFRRIYFWVGSCILVGGILLVPFLPYLIQGDIPPDMNLYVLYFLYLADTVVSYFLFSYKESLLLAFQRQDLSDLIRTVVVAVQYILQAVILLVLRSFYLYLGIKIICTICTNVGFALETKKRYPEYVCLRHEKVAVPESIRTKVKALLINNVCDRARNSFDSIILSSYLGLAMVGIYNNYYFIYSSLYGIILTICSSLGASVGNSVATESVEKNYRDMKKFSFMACWLFGWFAVCMLCLYQPFMKLWVGEDMLLSEFNMILFCVYFFVINLNNIRNQYINGNGLWDKLKAAYTVEAIGNIVLNLVLGKILGITGIILATILTIFFFNFVWRNHILFHNYFAPEDMGEYMKLNLFWAGCVLVAAAVTYHLCGLLPQMNLFVELIVRGMICVVLPNILLLVLFCRTEQFQESVRFAKKLLRKR